MRDQRSLVTASALWLIGTLTAEMQLRYPRAVSLRGSSTAPSQAVAHVSAVMGMHTAVWMPVFVCLAGLPKWSGRPWSTPLPTARWYSPSTGWRPCWSARDFWWAFLKGSLTVVSLHLINMQNTPNGSDDVFWIDGGHSGQLNNLPTSRTQQQAPVCSFTWVVTDTCVQMSWVMFWRSKKESFNQKESCVVYPAADPSILYFWLSQEIQKNLSISQSFTIANAESAALEQ